MFQRSEPASQVLSRPGAADADGDADVHVADFLKFQDCVNGPIRPPKCG